MAAGRTHAAVAGALLAPLGLASVWVGLKVSAPAGAGIAVGALAGYLITPDIDLTGMTYEERRIYKINPLLGHAWRWVWFGYSAVIPHRGISHWPVVGTLTRMGYLACMLALGVYALAGMGLFTGSGGDPRAVLAWAGNKAVNNHRFVVGLAGAWSLQDIGHLMLDRRRQIPLLALVALLVCVVVYQSILFF